MADGDAERDAIDLEHPPLAVGDVERLFLDWNLVLRLIPQDLTITRDYDGDIVDSRLGLPLHPHHHRHPVSLGGGANLVECRLLTMLVMRRDGKVHAAQAWKVGFRKADDYHVLRASIVQKAAYCLESLLN